MTAIESLRAIAEAATPGPREVDNGRYIMGGPGRRGGAERRVIGTAQEREDAIHFAAWSPERALAALDVIEAASKYATYIADNFDWSDLREAIARWNALPR